MREDLDFPATTDSFAIGDDDPAIVSGMRLHASSFLTSGNVLEFPLSRVRPVSSCPALLTFAGGRCSEETTVPLAGVVAPRQFRRSTWWGTNPVVELFELVPELVRLELVTYRYVGTLKQDESDAGDENR